MQYIQFNWMLIMLWFTNNDVVTILIFVGNIQCNPVVCSSYSFFRSQNWTLLVQVVFSNVAKLKKVKIEDALVILVERWRPKSHMFHWWIHNHLRRCCSWTGFMHWWKTSYWANILWLGTNVHRIYSCYSPRECTGGTLKLKWLKENMLTLQ